MGRERHLAAGKVRVASGRLEGGRRRPLGQVDEPELGVRTQAAMQRRRPVAGLGSQEVPGRLPGPDEPKLSDAAAPALNASR